MKHFEFWHPRVFEAPYYLNLVVQCIVHGIGFKTLAKANYALDHGEIGIGSKYHTQMAFDQSQFLPTELLSSALSNQEKSSQVERFAQNHDYPIILKSDVGCVGKGIRKVSNAAELTEVVPLLQGDYLLQKFTSYDVECGIFYTRQNGLGKVTGINQKHFPRVTGDGVSTLRQLTLAHKRYSHHWQSFLQYLDLEKVPDAGEEVRLSFIGSHTLGCMFTDDTHRLTPELEAAVVSFFENQPGYNFGRVDVKAESLEQLLNGDFVVIEVNGIASLPTHMFDPKYSVWDAYKIFLKHGNMLVKIAKENKHQIMPLLSYRAIIEKVKTNQGLLNTVHEALKSHS